ncbi:MAG: von Willebrand factor type A domain-containing protein [Polyangiaceae bacterium]|nr:von Willebrand factor type A domain-containing protein [Polyangiaceae bacterium]
MTIALNDPRLTAYALGEMNDSDRLAFEALLTDDPAAKEEIESIRQTAALLANELGQGAPSALSPTQRSRIEQAAQPSVAAPRPKRRWRAVLVYGGGSLAAAAGAALILNTSLRSGLEPAMPVEAYSKASAPTALMEESNAREAARLHLRPSAAAAPAELVARLSKERARGTDAESGSGTRARGEEGAVDPLGQPILRGPVEHDTEAYDQITDNPFVRVAEDPRSTFSIDVDTASYSIVRRFLNEGRLPPAGAVRIEEMINYFHYSYPEPATEVPFSLNTEVSEAPWATGHRLVRIGLKGKHVAAATRPRANLVFLVDVSGSMQSPDKLPLLKQGLQMLVRQLDRGDRVSLAVYAGSSGLVLSPTAGDHKDVILDALGRLQAGGSTNGGEGIRLAYAQARSSFIQGGTNRVILATDGDFNVGTTSQSELLDLIQKEAKSGVFLSVLGFGTGNYKDSTLEKLADKGNGNYAYIDSGAEARKVLVEQASGTLITIAKDVKIQLEFNPSRVQAFRLIGYENRVLAHQDFTDDKKDAGEIGADHTVTALYELVPPGQALPDEGSMLRYQKRGEPTAAAQSNELLTIKLRYKQPEGSTSREIEVRVADQRRNFGEASGDHQFAASVASFGMLLRNSQYKGSATYASVLETLGRNVANDPYRRELVTLVQKASGLGR